ncbi:hypothetical protein [Thermococcus gorgonarius]|uniref:Uncharacterized protein n=1 Tax=Thermococcus gorgonarius TaxID=71997 RepID=A0A2Z2MCB6_THEGO|nr:hypothetical protein [Thermococcus gorgonarius]ASJ01594.1 hypothetical protein A3K92_08925 [Thermococcus gorgonarius]
MIGTTIAAGFLLLIFIGLNLMLLMARTMAGLGSAAWKKLFRVEVPENEKKSYELLQTAAWIVAGVWGFWKLRSASLLAAFLAFFAFRSGLNVSKTLIYTLHDQKVVREHYIEGRLLSVIGTASAVSLLLEGLFVVTMAVAYKALSAVTQSGIGAGNLVLYLWLSGLAFGAASALLVARNNRGILMKNALPIVVFFSARTGKKKVKKGVEKSKEITRKPLKKLKG